MNGLARYMRHERRRAGLGLRDLARRIGFSPAYLSRLETGAETATPSEDFLLRWSAEVGALPEVSLGIAGRIPEDVRRFVIDTPGVQEFLRAAKAANLTPAEFREFEAEIIGEQRGY